MSGLFDSYRRRIDYIRISVTDRCNLKCFYCTDDSVPHLPRREILSYEEIQRVVQVAAELGVKKVRLTGGEPLVRPNLGRLLRLLSPIEGIDDISLTTNGVLLGRYAAELRQAGLRRVNVSLDTLKADRFEAIAGRNKLAETLAGIETAKKVGLEPVKINMVVLKGINDDELLDFARLTASHGWHVRFIEYMPLMAVAADMSRLVVVRDMVKLIRDTLGELEPCRVDRGGGPARYFRLPGARGTIGFIRPLSECFCSECNRLRLTAEGQLRPCLLSDNEIDLKEALRRGVSPGELKRLVKEAVLSKPERHSLQDGPISGKRQMRQIGG